MLGQVKRRQSRLLSRVRVAPRIKRKAAIVAVNRGKVILSCIAPDGRMVLQIQRRSRPIQERGEISSFLQSSESRLIHKSQNLKRRLESDERKNWKVRRRIHALCTVLMVLAKADERESTREILSLMRDLVREFGISPKEACRHIRNAALVLKRVDVRYTMDQACSLIEKSGDEYTLFRMAAKVTLADSRVADSEAYFLRSLSKRFGWDLSRCRSEVAEEMLH